MKKYKRIILFIILVSSLFFVKGIYALFVHITNPKVNTFSLQNNYSYTVVHKQMDLNGSTYTTVSEVIGYAAPGSSVTPEVLSYTGFTSPQAQTVTINQNNQIITYLYTRNQYTLTITDSQYVTTQTPSGTYYYGTPIHLVADADDGQGKNFAKWTDNTTNRDYTFNLSGNTTIGPIYLSGYTVTYVLNNGDPNETITVAPGDAIDYLPTINNNDCVGSSGDRIADGCTYVYELAGWYTEPGFVNRVNEQYVPTSDVTLYARWNKVFYYHDTAVQFTGSNMIDTEMQLFSELNAGRDFIVEFNLDSFDTSSASRSVIFANMNESGEPYPGVQFRWFNSNYNVNANVKVGNKKNTAVAASVGNKVILKRENNTFSYSLDGGTTFVDYQDYTGFNLFFDVNATFGGEYDANGAVWRRAKCTLSEMHVEFIDPDSYTIKFHPNGGSGMMFEQVVEVGQTVNIKNNEFVKEHYKLVSWNTKADGTGTSYANKEQITDIASAGQTVDLYAQWERSVYYYIHFDANGSSGTMTDQRMTVGVEDTLTPVDFTKSNYVFFGWNTAPDGSGTWYEDEQSVLNITTTEDDTVTLYAIFLRKSFERSGDYVFDGTETTFIDTGVNLYSSTTIDKDFEIRFTITAVANNVLVDHNQATILNCKDESNNLWPGFSLRFNGNRTQMVPTYKWDSSNRSSTLSPISTNYVPVEVVIRRRNGIVSFQHSYQGYTSPITTLYNQNSGWSLGTNYFPDNCSFGGIYNNEHEADRFFRGTLSDMRIIIED